MKKNTNQIALITTCFLLLSTIINSCTISNSSIEQDNVERINKNSIVITAKNNETSLKPNQILKLDYNVQPENATDKAVNWKVIEGSEVGNIDLDTGVVYPLRNGIMKIQAIDADPFADKSNQVKSNEISITVSGFVSSMSLKSKDDINSIDSPDKKITLVVTILPESITDKSILWSISPVNAASIDPKSGIITPYINGQVRVTARYAPFPSVSDSITLTFSNQDLRLSTLKVAKPDNENVPTITTPNGTLQLKVLQSPPVSTSILKWSTVPENSNVATINSAGLVTANSNGDVKIKVESSDDDKVNDVIDIKVTNQKPITKITLTLKPEKQARINVEDSFNISTILDIAVEPSDATQRYAWSIKSGDAVSLTTDGNLSGLKEGSTNVVVRSLSTTPIESNTITISSSILVPTGITLSRKQGEENTGVTVGNNIDLTTIFDITFTPTNSSSRVTYTSSNTDIATVTDAGVLTGIKIGTIEIVATTVSSSPVQSAPINFSVKETVLFALKRKTGKKMSTVDVGETNIDLNTVFDITDAQPITVSSVNWSLRGNAATITPEGVLTPLAVGSVYLKITSKLDNTKISEEVPFSVSEDARDELFGTDRTGERYVMNDPALPIGYVSEKFATIIQGLVDNEVLSVRNLSGGRTEYSIYFYNQHIRTGATTPQNYIWLRSTKSVANGSIRNKVNYEKNNDYLVIKDLNYLPDSEPNTDVVQLYKPFRDMITSSVGWDVKSIGLAKDLEKVTWTTTKLYLFVSKNDPDTFFIIR